MLIKCAPPRRRCLRTSVSKYIYAAFEQRLEVDLLLGGCCFNSPRSARESFGDEVVKRLNLRDDSLARKEGFRMEPFSPPQFRNFRLPVTPLFGSCCATLAFFAALCTS